MWVDKLRSLWVYDLWLFIRVELYGWYGYWVIFCDLGIVDLLFLISVSYFGRKGGIGIRGCVFIGNVCLRLGGG